MRDEVALAKIIESQRRWAALRSISLDSHGRTTGLDANLFTPLSDETLNDFKDGAGNELDGDLRSLRSSAALACNVFEPWKRVGPGRIAEACGCDPAATSLRFERKLPTGLSGTAPHLDVVIDGSGTTPIAIESKFAEIYDEIHNEFAESYFDREDIWKGLAGCRAVAESIRTKQIKLERLGAAQLVKHALGLQRKYGPRGFRLLYLWYEVPGDAARKHRSELATFEGAVGGELDFASLTHQELFVRLERLAGDRSDYLSYLRERYFMPFV